MAKVSTDDLLEAFKEMTLLELSEFVKQFETTFDVKAAAPVAVAATGGAAGGAAGAEAAGGQDEVDATPRAGGGRGAGRVRRHPRGRGRQEDPGHQGGAQPDEPGPEGGQGPGRRRAQD